MVDHFTNKVYKNNQFLLLLLVFLPLFVSNYFLYPYVFLKSLIFRGVVLTGCLFYVFFLLKSKDFFFYKKVIFFVTILFFCYLFLSSFFGVNLSDSLWGNFERMEGGFYYLLLALLFFLIANFFRDEKVWERLFLFIASSNLLVDILAIFQKLNVNLDIINYSGRVGSTLGNAAYLSSVLLLSLIFLLFFFYKNSKWRVLVGFTILLNLIVIFISATRGAIIAIFIGVLLFLIFSLLKRNFLSIKNKFILASFLVIALVSASGAFILKDNSFIQNNETLQRLTTISIGDVTTSSRLSVWRYALDGFFERPLFGWGIENFDLVFNKYFDGKIPEEWFDRAHNNYLDILLASGIFGLFIYLFLIFLIFQLIYNLYKVKKIDFVIWQIFTFGWVAYLIQNFFIFDTVNNYIFILFFIVFLLYLDQSGRLLTFKKDLFLIKYITVFFIVIFSWFLIFSPALANVNAIKSFKYIYQQDSKNAEYFLLKSLEFAPSRFGHEEILRYFGDLIDDEMNAGLSNNIDFAINLLEKQKDLTLRSSIRLASLYNFKGALKQESDYFNKTILLLEPLIIENQNRRDLYFYIGKAYVLKGDVELGLNYFQQALKIKEDKTSLWNLASVYIYTKDVDNVIKYGDILIDGDYDLQLSEMKKLVHFYDLTKDNERLEYLLSEIILVQKDPIAISDLAIVKLRLGKFEEANFYAKQAIELDPSTEERLQKLFSF